MQVHEIQQGKRYTDNRGNVRQVVAFEGDYPAKKESPSSRDKLRYKLLVKRRSSHVVGSEHSTTVHSFADWARRECF